MNGNALRVRGLFLVFFVLGFCGLIYEQFEYLVLAAVGARVALGDVDSARSLMALAKLPADRLDLPWFRYLGTIAAVKPRTQ